MNSKLIVGLSAFFLLVTAIISVSQGLVLTILAAAVLPFLNTYFLRFFYVRTSSWLVSLMPLAIVSAAVVLMKLHSGDLYTFLIAGAFACCIGGALSRLMTLSSQSCALCNRRLTNRTLAFNCPRCGLKVCEKACWEFESLRCRVCQQNRVPIFSADGRWWDRNYGRGSETGRCRLCLTSSENADLRPCRRCGRPFCRACWDHQNGICSHCGWFPDDLPEPLRAYLAPVELERKNA